jgi:hypothetical protein
MVESWGLSLLRMVSRKCEEKRGKVNICNNRRRAEEQKASSAAVVEITDVK